MAKYEDGNNYIMHTYYASLVRGLLGYYVKFRAPAEEIVRRHLSKYFGRMWCGIYTQDEIVELANKFTVNVINEEDPINLVTEDDEGVWMRKARDPIILMKEERE